jgi:hypothetical protein
MVVSKGQNFGVEIFWEIEEMKGHYLEGFNTDKNWF